MGLRGELGGKLEQQTGGAEERLRESAKRRGAGRAPETPALMKVWSGCGHVALIWCISFPA